MADVRKTVEIALQVKGIDPSSLNTLVTVLDNVQKSVEKATQSIKSLHTALSSIQVPPALDKVLTSLQAFEKVKIPNLGNIATGFKKLGEIKTPPDLSKFVNELQKFEGIKLPGVTAMVNGFRKMETINVAEITSKVAALNKALSDLDKQGGISAFKKFANDVSLMKNSFNDSAQATTKIKKALEDLDNKAKGTGSIFGNLGEKMKTVFQFRAISFGFQQLGAAVTNGLASITEYDQALKDLQAITGATSLEVAQMGLKIIEVASTTKFSASEVAQGMRTIGQAGFSATEAVQTMQAVSDLATGTLSDMSTTVDLVTTAMRVFQIDASQSSTVADVFANAVNRSKLTIDKLRTAMNYVGPIARDSGVSFKELAASMGTLANSGLRASTIGTGLRRIFAELIDPSKKLKEAAEEAGVALYELDPRTTSLQSVLSNLGLVIKDASTAFDIFGKRGASAALSLTTAGSQFQVMLETVGTSGTAAQQAAIQMEGLGVSFKNLKDKLGLLAIALGEAGISTIMRSLINIARVLVDVLTALTDSTLGKFIVSIGLTTVALYGLAAAFGAVKALATTALFTSVSASVSTLTATLAGAVTGVAGLIAALPIVGAILLALGGAFLFFKSSAEDAYKEYTKLADQFGNLTKQMEDYHREVVNLSPDSQELKEKNIELRNSLFATANEYTSLSKEARAAADSINPLTGEIDKNSNAIDTYNKKLGELQLDNLIKAGKDVNSIVEEQGGTFSRFINETKQGFITLGTASGEGRKRLDEMAKEAALFAKKIHEGNVTFEEMRAVIASWDASSLTVQQKEIIANYKILNEQSDKFLRFLIDTGKIGIDDTAENVKRIAEELGYSGKALDGVILKFGELKAASADSFSNIIEKWANDGIKSVTEFTDKYKALGGAFKEGEEQSIRNALAKRQELAETLTTLKAQAIAEAATAKDKEAVWKAYFEKERALLKEADVVRRELAKSTAFENANLLKKESEDLDKTLNDNNIKYKHNAQLRVKHNEDALRKYQEREARIIAGQIIDTTKQDDAYKKHLNEREVLLAKHLEAVALQEASGAIDSDAANIAKLDLTRKFYQESVALAIAHRDSITKIEEPEEYEKRNNLVLKAEEAYHKARTGLILAYTKDLTKANEEILENEEKLLDEKEKNSDKEIDIAEDRKTKLLNLAEDYKNKRISIEESLADKLTDIDDDIAENRAETASDILSLESSIEEKIRNVKKKGMSDEQKEANDRLAAFKYLAQGRLLLAQAESEKDKEKLARGIELIKQSQSIGSGLKSETDSTSLLKQSLRELSKARDTQGEIKELELLKKKNEEIAEAADKQAKAKEAYDFKVKNAIEASEKIQAVEDKRHKKEVSNLLKEIALYQEKARIASSGLSGVSASTAKDVSAIYEKNAQAAAQERKAVEETTYAQKASLQAAEELFLTIDKNGVKSFTNAYTSSGLEEGFEKMKESGTEAFQDVGKEGEKALDGVSDSISSEGQTAWGSFTETATNATKSMTDGFNNVGRESVKSVEKVEEAVKDLGRAIDRLKNKTITVTTNYVVNGAPARKKDGGRLPGFGGGDRRPILAEDGEWFINKFAVRKYGDAFMNSINTMSLPKFQTGGRVGIPTGATKKSGLDSLANFGRVNLGVNGMDIPALVHQDVIGELTTHLNTLRRFAT